VAPELVKGEAPIIAPRAQGQLEKLVSRRWCGCHVPVAAWQDRSLL
jgi:hypothetical protein